MAFAILGTPRPIFTDSSGSPYASGTVTIQNPSDSAVKASYPTAADADASTNGTSAAVSLNARGQPDQDLWGKDNEDYKIIIKDSDAATVDTFTKIRMPRASRRPTVTFTSTDATPTIRESETFITAGTTAITDFNNGEVGDVIRILAASSIVITHGSPVSLLGELNFSMVAGDTLELTMFNDQVWEETGRSLATSTVSVAKTESVTSFTNTLVASESGTTYFLNLVGGGSTVLPAPAVGLEFTFIVATAPTTAYTIDTSGGDNIMSGVWLDIVGELTYATARDIISFVENKSVIGDRLDIISDGTNWYFKAFVGVDAAMTTGQS